MNYNGYPYGYAKPQTSIPYVRDRSSAWNYDLGPNSSILLPEKDSNLLHLLETDAAGTKSLRTFEIIPHVEPEPIDAGAVRQKFQEIESAQAAMLETQKQILSMLGGLANGEKSVAVTTDSTSNG